MLLTLMLLSGWHWPTPEQVLYPTNEARLQACLTPKPEMTAEVMQQTKATQGKRLIFFVPPVNALAGSCIPTDNHSPQALKMAEEFRTMLKGKDAPATMTVVTLMAPIKEYNEARQWMASLVLKDSAGQVIKRWKPRTGMVRQLTPGSGLSILIFDAPTAAERSQVRRAIQLQVEVDWGQGQAKQVADTRNLPTY